MLTSCFCFASGKSSPPTSSAILKFSRHLYLHFALFVELYVVWHVTDVVISGLLSPSAQSADHVTGQVTSRTAAADDDVYRQSWLDVSLTVFLYL